VSQQSKALIAFEDVSLTLGGRPILTGIDLSIRKGEFLSVVGPSGCGKTSLLNLVAGFLTPSGGRVSYAGKPVTGPRQDIAIVFQDYGKALLPWRTASGNIALALEAMNYPKDKREARIVELLALIGLSQHAEKFPSQLSGGMQQRLQIARCLAQDPAVLLMDEPFGALDAMTRQALQDEVLAIAARTGATVLFITHDLEEAIYLGDRIVAMRPNPGRFELSFDIDLPRPRDQLTTRERPEFLRMRRELFDVIKEVEH
jgi:NitT/TauT family transport system ATP-binding protein